MKATILGGAVLLAAALAACGGKASFTINGNLVDANGNLAPLKNPGLQLANGDDVISVPQGATSFSFPKTVSYGDSYTVVVKTQPQHMTCAPASISGTAGRTETISLALTCTQNTYSVLVTVNGLTGDMKLTLINGSFGSATATATAPTVSFPSIPVGSSYGIAVYEPIAGYNCTVVNGSGVMGDANRADAVVNCVKNP